MNEETCPIHVLLIEDDPSDADLIQEFLSTDKRPGFVVQCAGRLEQGLEQLRQEPVDIVLADLSLPDSQGLEALTRIYRQKATVPVVVLTSFDDDSTAVEAVHQGAQDYLVKGEVDQKVVSRVLRYAIERKHTEVALIEKNKELERMNRLMMNREERILELKKEVNAALQGDGKQPRYTV